MSSRKISLLLLVWAAAMRPVWLAAAPGYEGPVFGNSGRSRSFSGLSGTAAPSTVLSGPLSAVQADLIETLRRLKVSKVPLDALSQVLSHPQALPGQREALAAVISPENFEALAATAQERNTLVGGNNVVREALSSDGNPAVALGEFKKRFDGAARQPAEVSDPVVISAPADFTEGILRDSSLRPATPDSSHPSKRSTFVLHIRLDKDSKRGDFDTKLKNLGIRLFNRREIDVDHPATFLYIVSAKAQQLTKALSLPQVVGAKPYPSVWAFSREPFDGPDKEWITREVLVYRPTIKGRKRRFSKTIDYQSNRGIKNLRRDDPNHVFYTQDVLDPEKLAKENASVLDIGTGGGKFVLDLLSRGVKDAVGIDISLPDGLKNQPEHFIEADARQLPFEDNRFNVIYSRRSLFCRHGGSRGMWGFRYKDDLVKDALAEAIRVLKPEGRLLLAEPDQRIRLFALEIPGVRIVREPTKDWDGIEITKQ